MVTESGASIQNISDPAWRFEPAPQVVPLSYHSAAFSHNFQDGRGFTGYQHP